MNLLKKNKFLLPILLAIVVLLFILLFYAGTNALFKNQYDDSYIAYRYAINLAEGRGLVFNEGERTDAASSLLFVLILSLFYKIGLTNLEVVSTILGLISALGVCLIVYYSIKSLTNNLILSFSLALSVGVHGFISGWSISGMETIFFTFLVSLFIYLYYFKKVVNYFCPSIVMVTILIARLEGTIILAVWFLTEVYKFFIKKERRLSLIWQLALFSSVLVILIWWRYYYYGVLISHALQFKKIVNYYQPKPSYVLLVWAGTSLVTILLSIFLIWLPKFKYYWSLYLYLLLSFVAVLFGPYSDGARYSVHLLPVVVILAGLTINHFMVTPSRQKVFKSIGLRQLVVVLLLLLIFSQAILGAYLFRSEMVDYGNEQACRTRVGKYLSENLNKGDYVLSGDFGIIAYQARNLYFIDFGLISSDVLANFQNKQNLDQIILSKRPKMIADTFLASSKGGFIHPLLLNQTEYILGLKNYSTLFNPEVFQRPLFGCTDGNRYYLIFDLSILY